jgi:hypothetical protein
MRNWSKAVSYEENSLYTKAQCIRLENKLFEKFQIPYSTSVATNPKEEKILERRKKTDPLLLRTPLSVEFSYFLEFSLVWDSWKKLHEIRKLPFSLLTPNTTLRTMDEGT